MTASSVKTKPNSVDEFIRTHQIYSRFEATDLVGRSVGCVGKITGFSQNRVDRFSTTAGIIVDSEMFTIPDSDNPSVRYSVTRCTIGVFRTNVDQPVYYYHNVLLLANYRDSYAALEWIYDHAKLFDNRFTDVSLIVAWLPVPELTGKIYYHGKER